MSGSILKRLHGVYQRAIRGSTEAERTSSQIILDRLCAKYSVSLEDIKNFGNAPTPCQHELEQVIQMQVTAFGYVYGYALVCRKCGVRFS